MKALLLFFLISFFSATALAVVLDHGVELFIMQMGSS